ncbi:over compensating males [Musca autumnalis]|uniref:over compensating males n=1 Tax=Musca autumnalis TaxID=221902 RepID=UPI003CEDB0A2
MIKFNKREWKLFRRLQRKHNVSTEFLRYNLVNIQKIIWYQTWPRIIIKRFAVRKRNRIFLHHYRLRRVLFDQANRKIIKRMRQNIKQWSRNIVLYRKRTQEPEEYIEETICKEKLQEPDAAVVVSNNSSEDVSKQLKEQLELLKSARRQKPLIEANKDSNNTKQTEAADTEKSPEENDGDDNDIISSSRLSKSVSVSVENVSSRRSTSDWQVNLESTPEKQLNTIQANVHPLKLLASDEKTEKSNHEDEPYGQQNEKPVKSGLNFLDMLMSKVGSSVQGVGRTELNKSSSTNDISSSHQHHSEYSNDSSDGFLGFDDNERIPGMLMTPIVPNSIKSNNSIFISETLNEYMRQNDLDTDYDIDKDKSFKRVQSLPTDLEGLMTPKTQPPHLDMPAVPDNLLRFRTVAERKSYLQKFAKNSRLSIINNEACIYRELQKRIRYQKCKPNTQQVTAQSNNSSMSFTRNGWMAASFINTEFNRYYYQMLDVDGGKYKVKLRGVRGNNDEFRKKPYFSTVKNPSKTCPRLCVDEDMWQDFKVIKTISPKSRKLNKEPLPSVFKPCPLSHKTLQKPLDDDAAALLLAGGSMAVVRMPTVELEVFPECGKPLNEIAKRYLQYILPHHDISREWAEFSVSTLKLPGSLKDAVKAATDSIPRKSFTFVIPYLNDRNHVLVRRVVDRSEKLDESFEQCDDDTEELVPKADFTFRQNLDTSDELLLTCADVVSDMINTVAISCSENSFIKDDPDMLSEDKNDTKSSISPIKTEKQQQRPSSAASNTSENKKRSKQNRVLSELRRLNATIIDAAVKPEKEKKPCNLEYCAMGCVCDSLADGSHVREHCGKTKCMWECNCKTSNQSRILRLETDGRTITTEDAFMLRRKATARLARMEKEFTSTVVLTENETLLINETNNDKKRRCTKAPKRYEYYEDDTDDELRKNSPKKTALTTIDNDKNLAVEVKEIREPVYIQDTILEQLKHCTVNLVRLKDMDNVAPWCLIHQLYKCFCKGKALDGKPMIIEKGENNRTIEHGGEEEQTMVLTPTDYKPNTKARYTFEKVEKSKKSKDQSEHEESEEEDEQKEEEEEEEEEEDEDNDESYKEPPAKHRRRDRRKSRREERRIWRKRDEEEERRKSRHRKENSDKTSTKESKEPIPKHSQETVPGVDKTDKTQHQPEKPKRSLEEVRERFFAERPECCRRQIPIPRRMFLYCNRKRRSNVLKYISEHETESTRLLLNEHVMRSVYYHKADNEKLRKQQQDEDEQQNKVKEKQRVEKPKSNEQEDKSNKISEKEVLNPEVKPKAEVQDVVDLVDDDEEDDGLSFDIKKQNAEITNTLQEEGDNSSPSQNVCEPPEPAQDAVITMKEFGTLSGLSLGESNESSSTSNTNDNSPPERQEIVLPKISNCFSLNAKANIAKPLSGSSADVQKLKQHLADLTSVTDVNSPAFASHETISDVGTQNSALDTLNQSDPAQLSTLTDNENIRDVYNSVIRTMNSLVSKKMQDVDFALRRESHIIPAPNTDILCIMKWSNFLDAFCQGFAFIWQVKSKEGTYLVATIRNMMPMICDAMGVVNITALKPDRVPLMAKMLLHNVRNEHTSKLAIVMQGKLTYWVIKGFLKADPSMACNKPTPETHPSLTKKINVLCTSLVKQRQKEEKKKQLMLSKKTNLQNNLPDEPTNTNTGNIMAPMLQEPVTMTLSSPITPLPPYPGQQQQQNLLPMYPIQKSSAVVQPPPPPYSNPTPVISNQITTPPILPHNVGQNVAFQATAMNIEGSSRKRKATSEIPNDPRMDSYAKMSTNIEFRKVTPQDVNEIYLPHVYKENHKWLVLDLHNDFSHIFVPDFRDLVSLDRIQKVINFAKQKKKIVKLQFFQNAPFDAFVTPKSGRKIYFGPLNMNTMPPTLILLQSVDGQMMLRELYQLKHNIQTSPGERTKAFWLLQMNGQTHFEIEPTATAYAENYIKTSVDSSGGGQQENAEKDEDDEDCMIIDEVENPVQVSPSQLLPPPPTPPQPPQQAEVYRHFNIASVANDLQITPATSCGVFVPVSAAASMNVANNSLVTLPITNTLIQPILPITPVVNSTQIQPQTFFNVGAPTTNLITDVVTLPASSTVTPTIVQTTSSSVAKFLSSDLIYRGSPIYNSPITLDNTKTATAKQNLNQIQPRPQTTITATQQIFKPSTTIQTTKDVAMPVTSINQSTASSTMTTLTQQPIAQKRRRVSIVCQNQFDRATQNIAVSAVINKILPENVQDIQVNQSLNTLKTISTIGSTVITKLSNNNPQQEQQQHEGTMLKTNTQNQNTGNTNSKPLVFDVSFVDGDEEPGASIVIKPNSSPQKPASSSSDITTTTTKINISQTPMSSSSTTTTTPVSAVPSPRFSIKTAARNVPYKVVKIPASSFSTGQLQQKLLYTKPNSGTVISTSTSNSTSSATTQIFNKTPISTSQSSNPPIPILPKKVLNTTNPIKIAGIPSIGTPNATIQLIPTSQVRIAPKPPAATVVSQTLTLNAASSIAQSITITPVTTTTPATSTSVTYTRILPKVTSAQTNPRPSTAIVTNVDIQPKQVTITNPISSSTITSNSQSTTKSPSSSNSGLTITSVQSFGVAPLIKKTTTQQPSTSNDAASPKIRISPQRPFSSLSTTANDNNNKMEASKSAATTTQQQSSAPPPKRLDNGGGGVGATLPPHIQYGYIVSPNYTDYKFVAKRVMEEFYVKVPSVGILKLIGLNAVNNYLNKHMQKMSNKNTRLGEWIFVAASKAVQMQNHQKSMLVRKSKPGSVGDSPKKSSDINKSPKVVNVTSMSEPILIDD